MLDFLREAAAVKPSKRQLDWFEMGMYAFIHFGPNTFTDREWGDGTESEELFNPAKLDCDQWVEAIKAAGLKGMILTAKHHDGFCLWPSKYTEHSVKNSPFQRDVVKEASEACRRGGIKFGFYLSPWDRNSKLYGTPEYNDYFCNQLTELLTGYGEIFCVWFDGACGEGPNGKKQTYDFERYFELIRRVQPGAVIFNDHGPDVRWCGNEAGAARCAEWAVVPSELCGYSEIQTGPGPMADQGDLSYLYNTDTNIGALPMLLYSKGLVFAPSEIDMSIRPGWFWHQKEEPHSLKRLFETYLRSTGANACLNLNIPPNRDGLLDERDVRRLREFGELLQKEFGREVPAEIQKLPDEPDTQPVYRLSFSEPLKNLRYVVLREDLTKGERVENFRIVAEDAWRNQYPLYQGTTIGNRKICCLTDPFAQQNPLLNGSDDTVTALRIHVTAARDEVFLREIKVFE